MVLSLCNFGCGLSQDLQPVFDPYGMFASLALENFFFYCCFNYFFFPIFPLSFTFFFFLSGTIRQVLELSLEESSTSLNLPLSFWQSLGINSQISLAVYDCVFQTVTLLFNLTFLQNHNFIFIFFSPGPLFASFAQWLLLNVFRIFCILSRAIYFLKSSVYSVNFSLSLFSSQVAFFQTADFP